MTEYKLKTPVKLGDETISVLKLEEPDLGSLVDAEVDLSEKALQSAAGMVKLLESCATNVTMAHIRKIKFSDLGPAVEACSSFFA